ncbi:hypothetical protein D3C79_689940 [compost metagenome]
MALHDGDNVSIIVDVRFGFDARQRRCTGTPAVQEAAMSYRILLIALLGLMTTACVPYHEGGRYYRTDYYTADRYASPGYYRHDRYYVAPQPRYYYQPAPRYYRPAPVPQYRPHPQPGMKQWHGNPRHDYGNRQRYDYGRDRDRHDYRNDSRRYQSDRWHSNGRGDGDRRPGGGRSGDRNWRR